MKINIYKLLVIAFVVMAGFFIVSGQDRTDPPALFQPPGIVENIIEIIQDDTIRSFKVWKHKYETENGVNKDLQVLVVNLDYEPFIDSNQINIKKYRFNSISKYYATFTRDSVDYVLCFYVLDWEPEVDTVEINYTIQVSRYLH